MIVDDQEYNIQAIQIIMQCSIGLDITELVDQASDGLQAV